MGDGVWTLEALKEYFDALRETDLGALRLANSNLTTRLEGFPQLYATRSEFEEIRVTLQKVERGALQREVYEQRHQVLEEAVHKVENTKVSQETFDNFIETYRRDQSGLTIERRESAINLAKQTGEHQGQIATWGQLKGLLVALVGFITIINILANIYIKTR